jgi:cellulose synthase/poly-beta-1,6-N-acetylglucosamine synthase-like glycosyltransferase
MISVVVPAYNAKGVLGECLEALGAQSRPPDEVIVVDDGSTDGTDELALGYGVRVLRQANAGPSAARNAGARAAQGDLLLFTDADCVPTPDWVEHMVAPLADSAITGVKGVYRTAQQAWMARFVQIEHEDKYDRMRRSRFIDFVDTYAAGYRRDVFLSAGGFDESLGGCEDQELSFRLAGRGHRFVLAPKAVVYHRHSDNVFWYARRKWAIGYWKAKVTRRHPSKLVQDSRTPQVLKVQMGLVGVGSALLALGTGLRRARLARWGLGCGVVFELTTLPFVRKAWPKDRTVALLAPLLLFVRAGALGAGFVLGNLRLLGSPYLNKLGLEARLLRVERSIR